MTITTTKRKAGPYQGDGVIDTFPFDFRIFESQDLCVTYANKSGAESILEVLTDYTVKMNEDQETLPGGNVILNKALMKYTSITLTSGMAYLQPTRLTNHGGFYPTVINDALDRLTIFVQQLEEQVNRSVKVTVSSETSADELIASIRNNVNAAQQSAVAAQACENEAEQYAGIAQNAADKLENGLQDLNNIKSIIVGKIELMPFRASELPRGWHHANGDRYSVNSVVGQVLKALPVGYKEDWGIDESAEMINLPNMYHTDGRAYFLRVGAMPGVIQEDAIRNIEGEVSGGMVDDYKLHKQGAFGGSYTRGDGDFFSFNTMGTLEPFIVKLDSSRVVPTAEENRPLNISFVPAVYLGV